MNAVSYDELNLVLDQLCEKRDELQDQIDNNALVISEMDSAGSKLYDESDDYDLFSPRRKSGAKQKTKLEQDRLEYEEQNNQLFLERNRVNILIDTLQRILDAENASGQSDDPEEKKESDSEEKGAAGSKDDGSDSDAAEKDPADKDATEKEKKRSLKKGALERDLTTISHKIELCKKFVGQDPHRTKIELDGVQKKLNRMIEKVSREKDL